MRVRVPPRARSREARPTGLWDDSNLSPLPLEIARNTPIVPEVCPKCAREDPTPANSGQSSGDFEEFRTGLLWPERFSFLVGEQSKEEAVENSVKEQRGAPMTHRLLWEGHLV